MTPRSVVHRRKVFRRATIVAVLLGSAAAHAVVVTTVRVSMPPDDLVPASRVDVAKHQPFSFSCVADAALGTAAQLAMCPVRFAGNRDQCTREARVAHELAVARCQAVEVAVDTELDLSDPKVRARFQPKPLVKDAKPVDEVVAAQLIEKEVADKLEQAVKQQQRPDPSGQVVEITKPKVEMSPDRARYLSEYDSAAKKETVARGSTEQMVNKPQSRALPPSTKPTPLPEEAKPPEVKQQKPPTAIEQPEQIAKADTPRDTKKPGVMAMRGGEAGDRVEGQKALEAGSRDGFEATSRDGYGPKLGMSTRRIEERKARPGGGGDGATEPREIGEGGQKREVVPVPNLRPSQELLTRAVGGGSVDKLDGVDDDDETALNSKKWKYATFFNRMKRQVAQNWHPDEVYLRRDPTGKVYGTKDRLTVLRVSLTPKGKLAKVYVAQSSDVPFLDDEAIRAFQEAEPFPNPPVALVDAESGLITFSFGFHFQIGDRSKWKIFRYR